MTIEHSSDKLILRHHIESAPDDPRIERIAQDEYIFTMGKNRSFTFCPLTPVKDPDTHYFYPLHIVHDIIEELDEVERLAVLGCEEFGNGKFIYHIHRLAQKGLMSLTPVPELQMISVYRLNPLGLSVRHRLRYDAHTQHV